MLYRSVFWPRFTILIRIHVFCWIHGCRMLLNPNLIRTRTKIFMTKFFNKFTVGNYLWIKNRLFKSLQMTFRLFKLQIYSFLSFLGDNFDLLGSVSGSRFPIRVRICWPNCIRIRIRNNGASTVIIKFLTWCPGEGVEEQPRHLRHRGDREADRGGRWQAPGAVPTKPALIFRIIWEYKGVLPVQVRKRYCSHSQF